MSGQEPRILINDLSNSLHLSSTLKKNPCLEMLGEPPPFYPLLEVNQAHI